MKVSDSMWTLGEQGNGCAAPPMAASRHQAGAAANTARAFNPTHARTCARTHPHPNTEDGELPISLTKLEAGQPWPSVIKGHEADPVTQQQDQQRLMLERFQREVGATQAGTRWHAASFVAPHAWLPTCQGRVHLSPLPSCICLAPRLAASWL